MASKTRNFFAIVQRKKVYRILATEAAQFYNFNNNSIAKKQFCNFIFNSMIYFSTMHSNKKIMLKKLLLVLSNVMFSSMMQERRRTIKGLYLQDWLMNFSIEYCFLGIINHSQIIFFFLYEMIWFKHKLRKLFSFRNWICYRNFEIVLVIWKENMSWTCQLNLPYVPREIDHFSLNTFTFYYHISGMFIFKF